MISQPMPPPDVCNDTQVAPSQGMSHEAVAALLQQFSGRCNHVTEPQQQQFTVDQLASLMMQMPTSHRSMIAEEQNRSMAQANTPSSASFLWPVQRATQCLAPQSVMQLAIVLSLCGGAGCAAMTLKNVNSTIGKFILRG
jgi:hypothetical protein